MSKRARNILVETMHRFYKREQVIQQIIQSAKLNKSGFFTFQLTVEELDYLKKEAS